MQVFKTDDNAKVININQRITNRTVDEARIREAEIKEKEIAAEERKHKRKLIFILVIVVAIIAFYLYLKATGNEMLFLVIFLWGGMFALVFALMRLAIKKNKSDQEFALEMKRMEMEQKKNKKKGWFK